MPKLTYWVCPNRGDSSCYNIRTKTKKAAVVQRKMWGNENYAPPIKHTITYTGAFDLVTICLGEGGPDEPTEWDADYEADRKSRGLTISE